MTHHPITSSARNAPLHIKQPALPQYGLHAMAALYLLYIIITQDVHHGTALLVCAFFGLAAAWAQPTASALLERAAQSKAYATLKRSFPALLVILTCMAVAAGVGLWLAHYGIYHVFAAAN